jgi:peptidyl-prolyl cis-trans isomerase SurA
MTIWTIILIICLTGPSAYAGDRVVGRVGDEPITHLEVLEARTANPALSYEAALNIILDRKIILEWARHNNVSIYDSELESVLASIRKENNLNPEEFEKALKERGQTLDHFRENLREQLIIRRVAGEVFSSRINITEEEIRGTYAELYPPASQYSISHILFKLDKNPSSEARELKRSQAEEILRLITGGADFMDMARSHSEDPSSAENGGSLGTFRQGELLAGLEEAALGLLAGEVAGPVLTSLGYHLIRLDSISTIDPPNLNDVRDTIRKQLIASREGKVQEEWIKELRKEIYFEIFPDRS